MLRPQIQLLGFPYSSAEHLPEVLFARLAAQIIHTELAVASPAVRVPLRRSIAPTLRINDPAEKRKAREALAANELRMWGSQVERQLGRSSAARSCWLPT
jgi:hypothetical protein